MKKADAIEEIMKKSKAYDRDRLEKKSAKEIKGILANIQEQEGSDEGSTEDIIDAADEASKMLLNAKPEGQAEGQTEGQSEHNTMEVKSQDTESQEETIKSPPTILDPEWTEYMMKQLHEDEIEGDSPTCDGLRRLFSKYVGEIIETNVDVLKCPDIHDTSSAVKVTIIYDPHEDSVRYAPNHVKRISDCISVDKRNTPDPWNRASLATAVTKAESRCFRKALQLRKRSVEETKQGFDYEGPDQSDGRFINSMQKAGIINQCSRNGVDHNKLLAHLKMPELDNLSYKEAQEFLRIINEYKEEENFPKEVQNETLIPEMKG